MSQDAQVRLRLDTSGARADLASLYGDMRNAPAIRVPGATGSGGIPSGVGGGGPGYGGFNVGGLLGSLLAAAPLAMLGAPVARDAFSVSNGILGGIGNAASGALGLAGLAGGVTGRQRAIDETARLLGTAYGQGGVGMGEVTSLYESLREVYEGPAKGEAEIRANLGWEQAQDTLKDILDVLRKLLNKIPGVNI